MPDGAPNAPRLARIVRNDEMRAWQDGYRLLEAATRIHDEERDRGIEAGRQAGAAEALRLLDRAGAALTQVLDGLEEDLALLAVDLAERVLGRFEDREAVLGAARLALDELRGAEDVVIHAAPQHLEAIRLQVLEAAGLSDVMLAADPAAGPRDCTIATRRGILDLRIDAQLGALRDGIRRWYREQPAP